MRTRVPAGRIKRPASHQWALFVFVAVAGVNIMLNAHGYFDILGVIVTVAASAALVAALFFAHARSTYTIGIITLTLVFFRGVQSLWYDIAAYRAGLLHGPVGNSLLSVVFPTFAVILLFLLVRTYTVGSASRSYFGLPPIPVRPAAIAKNDAADGG